MTNKVTIRKVFENSSNGQLLISLPKTEFKAGDYVVVRRLEQQDMK